MEPPAIVALGELHVDDATRVLVPIAGKEDPPPRFPALEAMRRGEQHAIADEGRRTARLRTEEEDRDRRGIRTWRSSRRSSRDPRLGERPRPLAGERERDGSPSKPPRPRPEGRSPQLHASRATGCTLAA